MAAWASVAKKAPGQIVRTELAGEKIESILDKAPANGAPIGGTNAAPL